MSASKLIPYFSSHLAAFGFKASPPDIITLNLVNNTRAFLMLGLALVKLLMPLWTHSSLFLIPALYLLIPLPLYRILMEVQKFQSFRSA